MSASAETSMPSDEKVTPRLVLVRLYNTNATSKSLLLANESFSSDLKCNNFGSDLSSVPRVCVKWQIVKAAKFQQLHVATRVPELPSSAGIFQLRW